MRPLSWQMHTFLIRIKTIHIEWATIHIFSFSQGYVKSTTFYHNIVWRDLDLVDISQKLIHYIKDIILLGSEKQIMAYTLQALERHPCA